MLPIGNHDEARRGSGSGRPCRRPWEPTVMCRQVFPATNLDGAERDCTSPQPNPHITETREVRYPWHPWYGEQVQIRESLIKGGQGILRCVPDGNRPSRSLEVPLWMFDRAVCCTMRLSDVPVVSCEALLRLKAFLRRDAAGDAETVIQAQHLSPPLKGDADAKAFRSLPGSPAEVVSPPCEESRVAGPADRSQAGDHGAAGTHAARAPRKLRRLRGRRGGER